MKANSDYTFGIASLEIVLLLLGAFLLGMLLCWLLRKLGLCCRAQRHDVQHPPMNTPLGATATTGNNSSTTLTGGRKPREFPDVASGGFTADINTLLRKRDEPPPPAATADIITTAVSAPLTNATHTFTATPYTASNSTRKDDLKKLEGIGPKLEKILNAAGIHSYAQLAAMTPDEIRPLLEAAGNQFKMHDPKSWPYQAELAAKGDWSRLKEYQTLLIAGKE